MRGHGQLHQNAADGWVSIQTFDQRLHLFLGCIRGQVLADRAHSEFLAGLPLGRDIRRRVGTVAHQDRC